MTKTLVSIRIPEALVNEFRKASKKDHYLDLSEAVRGIIRNKWKKKNNPVGYQIQDLKKEIIESIQKNQQSQLINELKQIRNNLVNDQQNKPNHKK